MAVSEQIQNVLGFIYQSAADKSLAAMEVKVIGSEDETATLLVAVRHRDDGEYDIAPLGRLDIDFMEKFELGTEVEEE